MNDAPIPNPDELIARPKRIASAYLAVFGAPENRTDDQRLVMDDLEGFCHAYRPCVELSTDGSIATGNHKVNEGQRTVWLHIRGAIIAAKNPPAPLTISRKRKVTS